jgi:hypothetical protein
MEKPVRAVDYARRLYDDVLGWYRSADTKAQIVLGIDGAFVAFLTSGIFKKPEELKPIIAVAVLSPWTWLLLCAMVVSLLASILAAIVCLWSRTYSRAELSKTLSAAMKTVSGQKTYDRKTLWFFQFVAILDMDVFRRDLAHADEEFEIEVMASQIQALAGNVRKKHRAANVGFLFAAVTLSLFLFAGISYVVEVHQVVRDLVGKVQVDQTVQHVYRIENGLVRSMEIKKP